MILEYFLSLVMSLHAHRYDKRRRHMTTTADGEDLMPVLPIVFLPEEHLGQHVKGHL